MEALVRLARPAWQDRVERLDLSEPVVPLGLQEVLDRSGLRASLVASELLGSLGASVRLD